MKAYFAMNPVLAGAAKHAASTRSMGEIIEKYRKAKPTTVGRIYFDRDYMRFFWSRVAELYYVAKDEKGKLETL